MEIYLDNSATTPAYDEVKDVMIRCLSTDFGNPSSLHKKGFEAEEYIEEAKKNIASVLKVDAKGIIFTSGGTEANNLALIGASLAMKRRGNHIITTAIEHKSVSETTKFLSDNGFEITYLPVDSYGRISIEDLKASLREETILVSVMYVNNEIGSVMPIEAIGKCIKEYNPNILFHVDAIQAFGKYNIYPSRLNIDLLSVSGHKIHGPKGSGFLYVKDKLKIKPIIYGGGQQDGMRSGTENVPAIAGLGVAVKKSYENFDEKIANMRKVKAHLIEGLKSIPDVYINGEYGENSAPHIISASFLNVKSQNLLNALSGEGIYVSSGSACTSNDHKQKHSITLTAIGLKRELLDSTIRFSLSSDNTLEEIDYVIDKLNQIVPVQRKFVRK